MDFTYTALTIGAVLVLLSIVLTSVSSRVGFPLLLLFLALGMLAGEDGLGKIPFNNYPASFLIGNLALAIILLDGGMRTRAESFRVALWPALSLATVGVLVTVGVTAAFAAWLLDLPIWVAMLLGAIVGSTDAAAVFSLLNNSGVHLQQRVGATLEIESGSNDPMAVFLTIALLEITMQADHGLGMTLLVNLLKQFGIGALMGIAGGFLLLRTVNSLQLAAGLYALLVCSGGVLIFAATSAVHGSGILAVYLVGILLGNKRLRNKQGILQVLDGAAWLSQIGMFLILGLLVTPSSMMHYALPALFVAIWLTLVARPLAVWLSLVPFVFSGREKFFISWVGLRGAVPIILALFPMMAGHPQAQLLFNVAFVVVLVSLTTQGFSLPIAARLCRVEVPPEPEPAQRMALEMPTPQEHEIFIFQLDERSTATNRQVRQLRMPAESRIAAVFRGTQVIYPNGDTELHLDDHLCVIGHTQNLPDISRLFSTTAAPEHLDGHHFFGDFMLDGSAHLADVCAFYGLHINVPQDTPDITLGEYIARRFGGHCVVGDKIREGGAKLVVAEMEGDAIRKVGIKWVQEAL
ncbi:MAG TPA: potassium/proton antiporter [Dongiaceae bacterium]|nr:potassium/proton antiporter [Dongiaceae bacterium]